MSLSIALDYRPAIGPIRDQGPRPTCLAHAVSTAHEYARASAVPLSPEYLHYFSSVGSAHAPGISVPEISVALVGIGQPTEADCSYHTNGLPPDWSPPEGVPLYRRESIAKPPLAVEVETSLNAGRPPVLGISLPITFHAPVSPWLISPYGTVVGLHAVLAVGLAVDGDQRQFLIRNSWGAEWADGGYAWLDRSFLQQHLREILVLTKEPS